MVAKRHDFRDKHQNSSSDPSRQSRLFSENASSASPHCPLINRERTAVCDLGMGLILWGLNHLDIFVTLQSFWFWIIVSNVPSYPRVLVWIREAQTLMWVRAQGSGIGPVVTLVPLSSAYSYTKWSCDSIESTAIESRLCPLVSL